MEERVVGISSRIISVWTDSDSSSSLSNQSTPNKDGLGGMGGRSPGLGASIASLPRMSISQEQKAVRLCLSWTVRVRLLTPGPHGQLSPKWHHASYHLVHGEQMPKKKLSQPTGCGLGPSTPDNGLCASVKRWVGS
jgi:hypothetical protein